MAWGFKDLPSPPTPEARQELQLRGGLCPSYPIKRLLPLDLLAFNSLGQNCSPPPPAINSKTPESLALTRLLHWLGGPRNREH